MKIQQNSGISFCFTITSNTVKKTHNLYYIFNTQHFSIQNRYKLSCEKPGVETVLSGHITALDLMSGWGGNDTTTGNVPWLDRLPVNCNGTGFISSFKVKFVIFV